MGTNATRAYPTNRGAVALERLEQRMLLTGTVTLGQQPGAPNNVAFHGDAGRSGFNQNETFLNAGNVASSFGQVWQSPVLDGHVYATPLYMDGLTISGSGNAANHSGDGVQNPAFQGKTLGVVFAATGGGSVYAIAAQDTNGPTAIAPGTILWKTHLGNSYAGIDGNSIGVLSTPIIDLKSGRIYVTASVTDYLSPTTNPNHGGNNFEVFALNLQDGSLVSGWPLIFTQSLLDSLNQNKMNGAGVAVPFSSSGADQRGALNLSPDGSTLYVDWACYGASNPGWMTTVATGVTNGVANGQTPAIVSSYSSVDTTATNANGGQWGAGGPSVDASGNVFVSTGDSPGGTGNPPGDWGNSVLEFGPGQTLTLTGVYTPWNYTTQDTIDSDLGGGSPILVNVPGGSSTTTELLAVGGKQGNGYLLDAGNHLNNPSPNANNSPASYPADLTKRPPGTLTANQDPSLYDTSSAGMRSYFSPAQSGPLSLFGPYNESSASGNTAKARDTPATFTGPDGSQYVIWAGSSKAGVGSSTPVAPSMFLTKVVHAAGQPAYLQIVAQNGQVMSNPGSNLITGNGTANEIDWIVDAGVQRTDGLTSFSNGAPTLYACNALTMQPLWSSAYQELDMGGKYNSVAVARGDLFVGTDRIQAFGLTSDTIVDDSVAGTGMNQFNYVGAGWSHVTGSSTMGTFDGTVSTDSTQGDYATLSFTGSQIKVFANEKTGYGTATFSVDGGTIQTVTLSPANSSPNGMGAGDVLVYTVSGLGAGPHTLKILNNAASNTISLDRVVITPPATAPAQLGVSLTEGGVTPSVGGVLPYTINFNNAGSILHATGVNAAGVTLTETVPANTVADLGNSTPGWTLTSGSGGEGSTYTFAVGSMSAGVTGSVVFSVDVNGTIPAGTSSLSNTVGIADTAGDQSTGTRVTALGAPVETKLAFTRQPPASASAGIALSPPVTVAAEDQFGNTFTSDNSSTVTLTLSGGAFSGGGTTATAPVVNGVATFSNLVLSGPGTYTLTATDGALSSAVSSSFTVAAATKLAFTQQPGQATAGAVISPAVSVAVEDASGNVISSDTSTVTLTLSHGSFSNGSTTATAIASGGVATFSNLVISVTGSYTLTATDGTLASAQSNSFNVAAQASRLAFLQQPNNSNAGEAINPSVTVALEDAAGNIDTSANSTVTLTLSGGTLFGGGTTASATASNGIATFNNLVVTAVGNYTLTASDGTLASAASSPFAIGSRPLTSIDDNNANNTGPQVVYSPSGDWTTAATTLANNFDGTLTTGATANDTASVTFSGTLITLYAAMTTASGLASVSIDGGPSTTLDLYSPASAIAPVYTSPLLTAGSHTIVLKVLGSNNGKGGSGAGNSVSIDQFVVGPATPTLAWATPADLTYGTALDGSELDAFVTNSAGFPGTFTYSPPAGTVLPVGQAEPLTVTFNPQDSADYNAASAQVLINVHKATPTITWTGPGAGMTYGQALGAAQLNATATINGTAVPGTFAYNPPAGTVPPAGPNYPLSVTFTPTDTADYNAVSANQSVNVAQATPVINWPNPADITDGTPLGTAQLDAAANVPGKFSYSPASGTVLAPGQHQSLSVTFSPTDAGNYNSAAATAYLNVDYGAAAKLAFVQQPVNTRSGGAITPAVSVAVEDSAGSTLPGNTDIVTLTLNGGTFTGGGNTATAQAINGLATFSNLSITTNGTYTLAASDGALSGATSNTFNIGTTVYANFNTAATDFTSQFATNNAGTAGGTSLTWGAAAGVHDQANAAAGGGIVAAAVTTDQTAVYTPATIDLSDGKAHTVSEFVTAAAGLNANDRMLQIGFIGSSTSGFNAGFSFISARIFGDHAVEFQSGNGAGTTAVSIDHTTPAGTIHAGDWLQLVFNTQEVASGSFQGTFSLIDYGATGIGTPTTVLGPVAYSVSGMTTVGTASAVYAGFRTATAGEFTSPLAFDNFAVDQSAARMAYLQQPASGTAGVPMSTPFVVAVEDINGNIVAGDSSTVTLTISHGTFANGSTTLTAAAVNGVATFSNVTINAAGSYILRASDTNPNLDPGYGPVTINGAAQLAFTSQPGNASAGAALSPAVTVAVEDSGGVTVPVDTSTVTLTLNGGTFASGGNTASAPAVNGVATFSSLVINAPGTYTLTAGDGALAGATSTSFTITSAFPTTTKLASSLNPASPGQAVIFTATVSATSGAPTGTVQFAIDGVNAGAPVPLSSGSASYTTSTLSAGSHAVTATYSGDANYAASKSATLTQQVGTLPAGWSDTDIGSPGKAGSSQYNASTATWTVNGGGTDIWGTSDQFNYAWENFSGNGSIVARVASVSNTNSWAKAGVMFRTSTSPGAAFADVVATPGQGVSFQWRTSAGQSGNSTTVAGIRSPVWVKLTRSGTSFAAYYSTNGTTWTQIGSARTVNIPTAALAGLAVTAHNNSALCTATFTNVAVG